MKAKVFERAATVFPLYYAISFLAASSKIGKTSSLTTSRLESIPVAVALITSLGEGTPILVN